MDILMDLLESSSSEDESDEVPFPFLVSPTITTQNFVPRVKNFIETVVGNYSNEEFKKNFRLQRSTANWLIQQFEKSQYYNVNTGKGRRCITAEHQMLPFLWFAANKETYREVANLFDIALCTFFKYLNNILDFLYNISKTIIKFPTSTEEKRTIAEGFERISNFPNVVGAIDGSYIMIRKPVGKIRSTYINRHDLTSITLQAICNSTKKFLDVCIGSPSRVHDSRVFTLSPISDVIATICEAGRFHLIGDAAYPIREYLLTPYRNHGSLTLKQRRYNLKHAQTRVKIENAFGALKSRFRQLTRLDFFTVMRMSQFVLSCCVLHNICMDRNDFMDNEDENHNVSAEDTTQFSVAVPSIGSRYDALRRLGELKRNTVADIL
ncbi:putative nuclease HARBI1 [Malaya genurostris]|uniref:putative nuclease HARBI1 n=1 Tax=Malaya genurostris TaxID=325434 RepID=UPI0026F3EEE4|nr:putative nuclease HARBI1 [Malaya genurostris]